MSCQDSFGGGYSYPEIHWRTAIVSPGYYNHLIILGRSPSSTLILYPFIINMVTGTINEFIASSFRCLSINMYYMLMQWHRHTSCLLAHWQESRRQYGPLFQTMTPAWKNDYIYYNMYGEITYLFRNFNGAVVEFRQWTRDPFLLFITLTAVTDMFTKW